MHLLLVVSTLILLFAQLTGATEDGPCVLPPTRHLNYTESCADHSSISAATISWAAQRGEYESAQVLLAARRGPGKLSASFTDLVSPSGNATLPKSLLSWRQQAYVFVRHTSRYADSGCPGKRDCWRPDPLLPPENNTVQLEGNPGQNQALWVTLEVPRDAPSASEARPYSGSMRLTFTPAAGGPSVVDTIPISLEVWPVTVPTTAEATVQHDWAFSANKVLGFYPNTAPQAVAEQWWKFMEAHRLPPIDKAAWNCAANPTDPICGANQLAAGPSYLENKTQILVAGMHSNGCNCTSCPPEVARANALAMSSVVEAAQMVKNAKLLAYGFDERPRSCERSIRAAFGAFLDAFPVEKYPQVRGTMAALNWAGSKGNNGSTGSHPSDGGMPMDMPYTDWVLQYQYYNQTTADAWVASTYKGRKRSMWLYHCIEPSQVDYLNIFIERPLIQARLLFWLASTQNIQGWLYWVTDLWQNCPGSPHLWQHQNVSVIRRLNGTSMFTDFQAGSVIWFAFSVLSSAHFSVLWSRCNQKLYDFWVNGDGYCHGQQLQAEL